MERRGTKGVVIEERITLKAAPRGLFQAPKADYNGAGSRRRDLGGAASQQPRTLHAKLVADRRLTSNSRLKGPFFLSKNKRHLGKESRSQKISESCAQ